MRYNCKESDEIKDIASITGLIYNIQRYSLHDGPGIRTLIFLKGCPLNCLWCANPESQRPVIEHMGNDVVGKYITAKEVIDIAKRDMAFYNRSGGGITLSGGEPLKQYEFSKAVISEAKRLNINVAVETSGYQKWDCLWEVLEETDIVLYDIKTMDAKQHMEFTGVSNKLILDNAKRLSRLNKNLIVRIPIIPELNDSFVNLSKTARFCKETGIKEMHFLPYHQLGVHKYQRLNREYKLNHVKPVNKEKLIDDAGKIHDKYGVVITVY